MADSPGGRTPLPSTREQHGTAVPNAVRMAPVSSTEFLELLARNAAAVEFEAPILAARAANADPERLQELERAKVLALRIRAVLEARRRRETELSALYETAGDLAALTDVDAVLEAIVRRARQLLHSDAAYLSLNDEDHGDTYMRVTDGIFSPAFRAVRLPMGAGLGGLVAQTATPYSTPDYFADARFNHTADIDSCVAEEELTSILGVPLLLGRKVLGVLYAANRTVRPISREEVALLVSLAAHAAIAIDNARLLAETQLALAELEAAGELLRSHTESVERAADAHDRLAGLVLHGGGVGDVAREVREVLGGHLLVLAPDGAVLASTAQQTVATEQELEAAQRAVASSRTIERDAICATPVVAGDDCLGALLLRNAAPLDEADRRILERAALVTALLLLFRRSVAEAEGRVRGELLSDLLDGVDRDPEGVRERARLLGTDLDRPHAVVVAVVEADRERARQAAAHVAALHRGFSAVHEARLVLILPDLDPSAAGRLVEKELRAATGRPLTAGVAGPAEGPQAIVAAHVEARRCLQTLLALGRTGEVACTRDLGFVGLLLGDPRDVRPFVRSVLGSIHDYDAKRRTALLETLESWFRNGGHLARTSEDLHVHVNTTSQRLERIGQLLGDSWREPERQLEIQLALRLDKLLSAGGREID